MFKVCCAALAVSLAAGAASAAPVRLLCNGNALDPATGHVVTTGLMSFLFAFDPEAQTMAITRGALSTPQLSDVKISDKVAVGSDGLWLYEIDRIDGIATLRLDPEHDAKSKRDGSAASYYKGTCVPVVDARSS
jgi:hypothetical protein